jgi:hypothetical protein
MTICVTYYDIVQDLQTLIEGRLNDETLCLYRGSHIPRPSDDTSTYLGIEASFGGYERLPLTWSTASLGADSAATTSSQACQWETVSSVNLPQVIGGVFALDQSGALAWSELLPQGSVTLTMSGQVIGYQAVLEQAARPE